MEDDNYVAWLRFTPEGCLRLCDSDSTGAFKVYRKPSWTQADSERVNDEAGHGSQTMASDSIVTFQQSPVHVAQWEDTAAQQRIREHEERIADLTRELSEARAEVKIYKNLLYEYKNQLQECHRCGGDVFPLCEQKDYRACDCRCHTLRHILAKIEAEAALQPSKERVHNHSNPGVCAEFFDVLPTTSEHLWNADHKGIPSGNCLKCGLDIRNYNKRSYAAQYRLLKIQPSKEGE